MGKSTLEWKFFFFLNTGYSYQTSKSVGGYTFKPKEKREKEENVMGFLHIGHREIMYHILRGSDRSSMGYPFTAIHFMGSPIWVLISGGSDLSDDIIGLLVIGGG